MFVNASEKTWKISGRVNRQFIYWKRYPEAIGEGEGANIENVV